MASLGASLLGRSGLRRVPLSFGVQDIADDLALAEPVSPDHGAAVAEPVLETVPEVVLQARRLARAIAGEEALPVPVVSPAVAADHGRRRVAFTLRLDADRHCRLRLTVRAEGRSAQQILITALDRYLADAPAAVSAHPVAATGIPATLPSLRRTPTGSQP
jgi:hypothetical protein